MAPHGLESVFFADSGSVSVEVALKTAIQYQRNAGHPEKTRFLDVYKRQSGNCSSPARLPYSTRRSSFASLGPFERPASTRPKRRRNRDSPCCRANFSQPTALRPASTRAGSRSAFSDDATGRSPAHQKRSPTWRRWSPAPISAG